ncbi:MAG: hypothetical protein OXQ96_01040 [Alphaproteobacteria bacterium]|nr:hypothetical protein [Alphaproteobacteria bacterium]
MTNKLLHALFIVTLLVIPVLAQAAPCIMAMSQEVQAQEGEPCPSHQSSTPQPDHQMSVAECVDVDMMTGADLLIFKLTKSDHDVIAVLPLLKTGQVTVLSADPRAPPTQNQFAIPHPSLILTTQRFRV